MPPIAEFSIGWLRLRSGTRSAPVKQAANRKFAIVFDSKYP
jgi:hypothetical protein